GGWSSEALSDRATDAVRPPSDAPSARGCGPAAREDGAAPMTDLSAAPRVNVLDPEFYVDPWDAYRLLLDAAPVFGAQLQQLWAISRYEDVIAIERDGARFSSFSGSRPHLDQRADLSMINLDDPDHQAQRSLVLRRFTPRAVRAHEA